MSNISHISYRINERDDIVFVNDAWSEFALANGAPELVAEKVLNCNLWDFISDVTTRELYRTLVNKARAGHPVKFNLRCDSPELRRLLEMKITLLADKNIQFDTRLIHGEKRIYQDFFQNDARRTVGILVICSWCEKIETSEGSWHETEEAVSKLKLFESENTPQISHGMCVSCYQSILEKHKTLLKIQPV